jgi:uridylate kinase
MTQAAPAYKRIVLKLSGEALSGSAGYPIDPDRATFIAQKIAQLHRLGVQIGVVIGAGNLWRGEQGVGRGMDQSTADYMGMLGTVMNALALRDALERINVHTRVQTAIPMNTVAEPYIRLRAIRHMEKDRVVIFAGGTGSPFFTTDTAAALRAADIGADIVIKATKVNGVYDKDPRKHADAVRYASLSYTQVIQDKLQVMDLTAFTMCEENKIPIMVLDFWHDDDLYHAVLGDDGVGTIIR